MSAPGAEEKGSAVPLKYPAVDKEKEREDHRSVPCCTLFRYATFFDWMLMLVGAFFAVCQGALMPLTNILFGRIIDVTASMGDFTSKVNEMVLYMVILAGASAIASFFSFATFIISASRQTTRIRKAYFAAVTRQDMPFFDLAMPGSIANRVNEDCVTIQDGLAQKLGEFFSSFAQLFAGFGVAFYFGWELTLVLLGPFPIMAIAGACLFRARGGKEADAYADAGAVAMEALSSIRTVVSFRGEVVTAEKYDHHLNVAQRAASKRGVIQHVGQASFLLIMFGMYALGFWFGAKMTADSEDAALSSYPLPIDLGNWTGPATLYCGEYAGQAGAWAQCVCSLPWDIMGMPNTNCGCGHPDANCFTGGKTLMVFFSVIIGGFSLAIAGPAIAKFSQARAAAFKIFETIDRQPAINPDVHGKRLPEVRGNIVFENVRFMYPSRPDKPVFADFSLDIKSGETIALVGASGCGKSTIAAMVARFYDPTLGRVCLDGTDLKDLDLAWLRGKIGIVSQEPLLFDSSVEANIAFGCPGGATTEQVIAAAKAANAHQFIMSFPEGYRTSCGALGGKLSGGQKQRIAIARALVRDPAILILDEATSALDTVSEQVVQQAIDDLVSSSQAKRTIIIIAHRLTTVRNADRIVVLSNSTGAGAIIAEQGTHNQLLEIPQGIYQSLVGESGHVLSPGGPAVALQRAASEGKSTATSEAKATTEEEDLKSKKDVPSSRVWAYSKPEIPHIVLGLLAAMGNGSVMPFVAIVFIQVLTVFYVPDTNQLREESQFWALMFIVVAAGGFLVAALQGSMFSIVGERLTTRIRSKVFRAMLRQDISWYDDPKNAVGALSTRLSTDAVSIRNVTGPALAVKLQNIVTLLFGGVVSFMASWQLALVVLSVVPLMTITSFLQMKIMLGGMANSRKGLEESSVVVSECVTGIREIQAFGLERVFGDRFSDKLRLPHRQALIGAFLTGFSFAANQLVMMGFYALTFWYGAKLVSEGTIAFDKMMLAVFALAFAAGGVGHAAGFAGDQAKADAAKKVLFDVIDRIPSIPNDPWSEFHDQERLTTLGNKPTTSKDGAKASLIAAQDPTPQIPPMKKIIPAVDLRGLIVLDRVTFRYPTRPDCPIFASLSLTIKPGQTVALVGASGCGKSTVVQLLSRFYDPRGTETEAVGAYGSIGDSNGKITLDGVDLRDLDVGFLRDTVGMVGQEPVLFNATINENIAYGKRGCTDDDVIQAAKSANAHDFIMSFPEGYQTIVGGRGKQLSGGQKQRIAIARALVKNPKVLLLDEATSALDSESEQVVQAALDELLKQSTSRTTIIVAHRLSTIKNCDCIFVLEPTPGKGSCVVEFGTHEELMEKNGPYASLRRLYDGQ